MECFIIENGAERKADLEDLLPVIKMDRRTLQLILREAVNSGIDLAKALAFLSAEIKEIVYRNVSSRTGGMLKKQIGDLEAGYADYFVLEEKAKLINLIGGCASNWYFSFPKHIIWKGTGSEKVDTAKLSPVESSIKQIEKALDSGWLDITSWAYSFKLKRQDLHRQLDEMFQNYRNDLGKIRQLVIEGKDLPAAALLFETGKIEVLDILWEFDGAANGREWPPFLENCQALTKLTLNYNYISEFPSWIRNASSLRVLYLYGSNVTSLPDWIGDLRSLTKLSLLRNRYLERLPSGIGSLSNLTELEIKDSPVKELPGSIGNLINLRKLVLGDTRMEKLPDSLGDLQSLVELSVDSKGKLEALPDSIGNLKNLKTLSIERSSAKNLPAGMENLKGLQKLYIYRTLIEKMPDWLGGLESLTSLSLPGNKNMKTLPDSIGNLSNLVDLDISFSPIEKLPDTIVNCTTLEYVNILGTEINLVPDFIKSIKNFINNKLIELIPPPTGRQGHSISYRCFCNSYYRLVETIFALDEKAKREGLLSLEEELWKFAEGFFLTGIRFVVDGTDAGYIREVLRNKSERETDSYRKKLMEVATEGIIGIQGGNAKIITACLLASLVKIENNPLDAACAEYLSGGMDAIDNIDFSAAIQPEDEREEMRFIKRVLELCEIGRREGLLPLEKHLDREGIAARDVFEYGLVLVIDGWDSADIAKILDNLITHEADPVRKNIAQAKKTALLVMSSGSNPRFLIESVCAFFDEGIAAEIRSYFESVF